MKTTKLDGYLDKIRSLFNTEEVVEEVIEDPKPEDTPEKFGTVEAEGADGVITISFPGEALEVGAAITTLVDEAEAPVPTGEYSLSDGSVLVVVEDGVVGEIRAVENAEETPEEEMETEAGGLKDEQIGALIDGIADIISKFQEQTGKDIAKAIADNSEALRLEFNKPAAEVEEQTPEGDAKEKVVQGLSKFVKEANTK